jgi:hypothetical protein
MGAGRRTRSPAATGATRGRDHRHRRPRPRDTPVHSLLHEACHLIVLPPENARSGTHRRHRFDSRGRRLSACCRPAGRRLARRRPRPRARRHGRLGLHLPPRLARAYVEHDADDARGPGCARGLVDAAPPAYASAVAGSLRRALWADHPMRRAARSSLAFQRAERRRGRTVSFTHRPARRRGHRSAHSPPASKRSPRTHRTRATPPSPAGETADQFVARVNEEASEATQRRTERGAMAVATYINGDSELLAAKANEKFAGELTQTQWIAQAALRRPAARRTPRARSSC